MGGLCIFLFEGLGGVNKSADGAAFDKGERVRKEHVRFAM